MRCAYQTVKHRGVAGTRPCGNSAKHGHRYCHRHLLEERQEIEKIYPVIWVVASFMPFEGYTEPEASFLTKAEALKYIKDQPAHRREYLEDIEVAWRGGDPDE